MANRRRAGRPEVQGWHGERERDRKRETSARGSGTDRQSLSYLSRCTRLRWNSIRPKNFSEFCVPLHCETGKPSFVPAQHGVAFVSPKTYFRCLSCPCLHPSPWRPCVGFLFFIRRRLRYSWLKFNPYFGCFFSLSFFFFFYSPYYVGSILVRVDECTQPHWAPHLCCALVFCFPSWANTNDESCPLLVNGFY